MQAFTPEKGKEKEEEEEEAIGFENHGAKRSKDLEGLGDVDEKEKNKHKRSICGDSFKSSKDLGGHKSSRHRPKTRKSRPRMVSSGRSEVACFVCHKKFKSVKAVRGHMRVHPDRGWKGIFTPSHRHPLGNSSSSTLSFDAEIKRSDHEDDGENPKLLGMKGQRGSRSVLKVDETDPKSEDIDTTNLLVLATTAINDAETSQSHSDQEKKKKKKRKLSEIEKKGPSYTVAEEGSAREKHVCVTCNRPFPSDYALRGHRASCSYNGNHICNICRRSFSTGPALGGHKRSLRCTPVSSEAVTSPTTAAQTTGQASGSSSQVTETAQKEKKLKRPLTFNLNELPPKEEEEKKLKKMRKTTKECRRRN